MLFTSTSTLALQLGNRGVTFAYRELGRQDSGTPVVFLVHLPAPPGGGTHQCSGARRLPNSTPIIYPDAGHGGIFQFYDDFVSSGWSFWRGSGNMRLTSNGPGVSLRYG